MVGHPAEKKQGCTKPITTELMGISRYALSGLMRIRKKKPIRKFQKRVRIITSGGA